MRFAEAPGPGRYLLALGLFTAGLFSKSIVVTLPAALLVWHWWRAGPRDADRPGPAGAVLRGRAGRHGSRPVVLHVARAALARLLVGGAGPDCRARVVVLRRQAAVAGRSGRDLPRSGTSAPPTPVAWTYVLAAAALAALLWFGRRRLGRGPLAGALFFAVTLSPVLGFVDYGLHAVLPGGGSVPVSGGARGARRADRGGRPGRGPASGRGEDRRGRCAGPRARGAGRAHVAPGGHLPRRHRPVQPHRLDQSRGAGRAPEPGGSVVGRGSKRGGAGGGPHRLAAAARERGRACEPRPGALAAGTARRGRSGAPQRSRAGPAASQLPTEPRGGAPEAGSVR